jgi:hypothetical protein
MAKIERFFFGARTIGSVASGKKVNRLAVKGEPAVRERSTTQFQYELYGSWKSWMHLSERSEYFFQVLVDPCLVPPGLWIDRTDSDASTAAATPTYGGARPPPGRISSGCQFRVTFTSVPLTVNSVAKFVTSWADSAPFRQIAVSWAIQIRWETRCETSFEQECGRAAATSDLLDVLQIVQCDS